MTLVDFGDFKLRFDPKEVRISIDGDLIDVGARSIEETDSLKEEIKRIKSHIPSGGNKFNSPTINRIFEEEEAKKKLLDLK